MPRGIPVQLMLTCLADAFYGEVGIATVRVLEHTGACVQFPDTQTCCGQPPFNAGDATAARQISAHQLRQFDPAIPIITPSSSCAAMMRHGRELLGLEPALCFELCEYLVKVREIRAWPLRRGTYARQTWAYHRACHGRALGRAPGLDDEAETLLRSIPGLALIPLPADAAGQCCGFGGSFSATHGQLSAQIGREKLGQLEAVGADGVLTGDLGCMMHLQALAQAEGKPFRFAHVAQILAEVIPE